MTISQKNEFLHFFEIKNRVSTPFPTVIASDGTVIKIEPLLGAAGDDVMSSSSAEVAVSINNNVVQSSHAPKGDENIIGQDAEEEKPSSLAPPTSSASSRLLRNPFGEVQQVKILLFFLLKHD